MISSTATTEVNKREYDESALFRVEQPASNPFMTTAAVVIREDGKGIDDGTIDVGVTEVMAADVRATISDIHADIVAQSHRQVDRYPSSARAYTNLGLALINKGQLHDAAKAFEAALGLVPWHYPAVINLVHLRIVQGQFDDAERMCAHLLQERPSDPNPLMSLADIAVRREDLVLGATLWQHAIDLQPRAAFARLHLAMVLLRLSRHREAIAQLKVATRLDVRSAALHQGLGVAYTFAKDQGRALRSFKTALTLAPGMPEAIHGVCDILLRQGKAKAAESILKRYLTDTRDDAVAYDLLAWAYVQQSRFREARAQLFHASRVLGAASSKMIQAHRARILNNLGVCDWWLHEPEEAIRRFKDATNAHPDSVLPYHNLARLLMMQHPNDAWEVLRDCKQKFPADAETPILLASVYEIQGQYNEAIEELERVVRTGKASADTVSTLAGLLTDCRHDPAAGLELLDKAHYVGSPSDAAIAANNRAYAHLMQGNTAAARDVLASVQDGQVSSMAAIVLSATRGLLALREGDIEGGKEGYEKAERLAKAQGQIAIAVVPMIRQKRHLELAHTYELMGDRTAARREVREALFTAGRSRYQHDLEALAAKLNTTQS